MINSIKTLLATSNLSETLYKWMSKKALFAHPVYAFFYRAQINRIYKKFSPFPPVISIETTNFCNARCSICPYPSMKRKKGFMKPQVFEKIANELKTHRKHIQTVFLSGFGEALTDKRLEHFIKILKEYKIRQTAIVTNASLLSKERAIKLTEAGLDELHISIDGGDKETYNAIRKGLSFEKVYNNLKALSTLKRKPEIFLKLVLTRKNKSSVNQFRKRFSQLADRIFIRFFQDWHGGVEKEQVYTPHKNVNPFHPCIYLFKTINIYFDGTVPLCCLDYEAQVKMGNILENSIEDIWHGKMFNFYRRMHLRKKRNSLTLCSTCNYFPVWW